MSGKSQTRQLEDAVMDMFELGVPRGQIIIELAQRFSCTRRSIESVLDYMREGTSDAAFSEKAIASQSAAFIAALRHHHPEKCRGEA